VNSIFLRIYGGMCAALILVAVLGVLALHLLIRCAASNTASAWPTARFP